MTIFFIPSVISQQENRNCTSNIYSLHCFRLKSRYMSVALRGSPRGTLGTLRRTASLEYFLDCDKECDVEEVELTTPPPRARASGNNEYKVPRQSDSNQ